MAGRVDWAGSEVGGEGSWVNTALFLRLVSLLVSCLSMESQAQTEIVIIPSYRRAQTDWLKSNECELSLVEGGQFSAFVWISEKETSQTLEKELSQWNIYSIISIASWVTCKRAQKHQSCVQNIGPLHLVAVIIHDNILVCVYTIDFVPLHSCLNRCDKHVVTGFSKYCTTSCGRL